MKFYMKRNSGRPLKAGEKTFKFTTCEQASGTWFGVFATGDKEQIELLDQAVKDGKILEISEGAYRKRLKNRTVERPESSVASTGYQTKAEKAKPAKVESVKDADTGAPDDDGKGVSDEELNATGGKTPQSGAYAANLNELAAVLEIDRKKLDEIRKREGCPAATGKGYHVTKFQEFIAGSAE